MGEFKIVIEHLEEELSPWLLLEYRHASMIAGKDRLIFANVPMRYHKILSRYGTVYSNSALELFDHNDILILDPQAPERLEPTDLNRFRYIIIGGILGDHPPRGRTKKLLSSKAPRAAKRNIGGGQYSIDGSVYVVMFVSKGKSLDQISYVDGVEIIGYVDHVERRIFLPYRYPLVNDVPLLAPGLEELLLENRLPDYIWSELTK